MVISVKDIVNLNKNQVNRIKNISQRHQYIIDIGGICKNINISININILHIKEVDVIRILNKMYLNM